MHADAVDEILRESLEDHRLSRRERRELKDELDERGWTESDALDFVRHRAFALARNAEHSNDGPPLEWLEGVVKTLASLRTEQATAAGQHPDRVFFSPGDACLRALLRLVREATTQIDVCVFTITDDRLTESLLEAHGRGISLRVITDNDKSEDRGSDADRLLTLGVPVRMDRSEHHMHHKFALFDGRTVATGSYNWTRSAARYNRENVAVSSDRALVEGYQRGFERLWKELA